MDTRIFIPFLLSAFVALSARAEDFASVSLGTFQVDQGANFRLDSGSLGPGTIIDLEDNLGLDESGSVFRLDAYARLLPRHRIDFGYVDLSRDATRTLDQDIQFGDEVFTLNSTVNSEFDLEIYKLSYSFSPIRSESTEVGVSAGVFVQDIAVSISETNLGQAEAAEGTAPLPLLGLRGRRSLTDKLSLHGSVDYFFIDVADYEGQLTDISVGIEYALFDHLGLGAAYNDVSFELKAADGSFSGEADWGYDGFLLYVRLHL